MDMDPQGRQQTQQETPNNASPFGSAAWRAASANRLHSFKVRGLFANLPAPIALLLTLVLALLLIVLCIAFAVIGIALALLAAPFALAWLAIRQSLRSWRARRSLAGQGRVNVVVRRPR